MTRAIMFAALSSDAGKTTITLGFLRALAQRGLRVASAKSGPDYIDPQFHQAASGRATLTLDAFAMDTHAMQARASALDADLLVIEGAMGLFDGAAPKSSFGQGSSADVAAALGAPIILIIDVAKMGQSAAAIALGARRLRDDIEIAGVFLNRVGSSRHAAMVRSALAAVHMPVLGTAPRMDDLVTPSRHLGLQQAEEVESLDRLLETAARLFSDTVIEAIMSIARAIPQARYVPQIPPLGQNIAVAQDRAFRFCYPHFITDWRHQGAEIMPFSPLDDQPPPANADAVFLPGGYPELCADRLARAESFKNGLRSAAARGATVYGECGGYMSLGDALIDANGDAHAMAGLLPVVTSFQSPKRHLGYRRLRQLSGRCFGKADSFFGHEFHYSRAIREGDAERLFEACDAAGEPLGAIGLRIGSVMGSYAHIITCDNAGGAV